MEFTNSLAVITGAVIGGGISMVGVWIQQKYQGKSE